MFDVIPMKSDLR